MIKKTVIFILFVVTIQSCNLNSSGTWRNDQIQRRTREEIKALNDKLVKSMGEDDVASVKGLMADILKKDSNIVEFVHQFSNSFGIKEYKILDEYYVKNTSVQVTNTLISENSDDNGYEVSYLALNKEMYASLLVAANKNAEMLILAIYGKYGEDWKLNLLQYGQYRALGKNAPDYFNLAKASYEKSHLLNAVNYISLSKQLLKPLNNFFKFKKEAEVNAFFNKVMKEADSTYSLPLTLEQLQTKPKIYKVVPQVNEEEIFPMIYYVSSIDINDETALKNENELVRKEVDRIFPGIDKDKKYIFYWVSNELPNEGTVVEQYGFVDTLKLRPNH